MEKRKFGKTDMNVSVLGFGAAPIGMEEGVAFEEVRRLLEEVLELGVTVIDTASYYDRSEEYIGRAIGNRRKDYYLFSKCGEGESVGLDYPDWDARAVRPSVERSLKRLQTDYLDLVLIHSCSEAILRQGDLIAEVKKLKEEGLVRYIGYSGDSTDMLYAIGTGEYDAIETSVNIADQEAVHLTLKEAEKAGLGVIAKRPVANVVWKRDESEFNTPGDYKERLEKLSYPFLEKPADDILETALRFTLSIPQVHTAIVGTKNREHFRQNVQQAAKGKLEEREMEAILRRWQEVREPAWAGLK
ncbi:aldo/keto reductase [Paenibacillus aurantius]|uniref:Aldo/keto reductase n=1 Tax=Paenibacillus aurantius TaxID=2918900 RepID=A0AA96LHX7_9BACL|nr:aldo/keto reductase [Paenibacillus aurantius]WNQ12316.1 aldo/keto reductase [Paenibacillus aurantius]